MSKDKKRNLSSEKDIIKAFGKIISTGNELVKTKGDLQCVPFSPSLDLALNGGLLEGTWTIISGNPKTGKTTSCLQVCKNAQDCGRPVIYVDGESRLKKYNLEGTQGLDLDKIQIIHSPEDGEQLSAEDFLDVCESMILKPENKGAICIIDSCSSLVPRAELESPASASLRASLPKLLSHWVKKNAQNVVKNKIVVIIITHYITNTSGYGKVKIPDCGVMVQYQADTRLDIARIEDWREGGDSGKKIGQLVHWKIDCSAMGASGNECISYIRYGKGIDKVQEIIELAVSFGIIEKGGSWYTLSFLEEPVKVQGMSNVYDFLSENPEQIKVVTEKVMEMLL